MSTETTDIILFENDHYRVIQGMSERFVGNTNQDGENIQYECYLLVNKATQIVERESFVYPQILTDAEHFAAIITSVLEPEDISEDAAGALISVPTLIQ